MAEITNSLNYQQYTPSPVGEGWGEGKKTKGFPMPPCTKLHNKIGSFLKLVLQNQPTSTQHNKRLPESKASAKLKRFRQPFILSGVVLITQTLANGGHQTGLVEGVKMQAGRAVGQQALAHLRYHI